MTTYKYKLPKRFDPTYLRLILEKEFGEAFIGWSETTEEIRIDFARDLTKEEKAKLDSIIENPPMPEYIYEYREEDSLEKEIVERIGIKPSFIDYDKVTRRVRIYFDKILSPEQIEILDSIIKRDPKKIRIDATGKERLMTDEEFLINILENLDKFYEFELSLDVRTGRGNISLKRKQVK